MYFKSKFAWLGGGGGVLSNFEMVRAHSREKFHVIALHGNKYERFLINSESFTKNCCVLQTTRDRRDPKSCPIIHCLELIKGIIDICID